MNGLGLDFGIDSGQISDQVVNAVWPKIDAKINEVVPTITKAALGEVKKQLPLPLVVAIVGAASIVTIASAMDLYDRYKKVR